MSDEMGRAIRQNRELGRRHNRGEVADDTALGVNSATLQQTAANVDRSAAADILALQRGYGNSAVRRLIQAKLIVGPADDVYEREADRVADQVMSSTPRATSPVQRQADDEEEEEVVQTKPVAGPITPLVQREGNEDEEEAVQTASLQRSGDGSFAASSSLESRLSSQKGRGSGLPDSLRSTMEPRFGADFSAVRIHTDAEAVQMNREVNAQAFTHGRDIYMGEGKYSPDTSEGQRLLAHELTHVVQQTGAGDGIRRQAAAPEEEDVQRQPTAEEEEEEAAG